MVCIVDSLVLSYIYFSPSPIPLFSTRFILLPTFVSVAVNPARDSLAPLP